MLSFKGYPDGRLFLKRLLPPCKRITELASNSLDRKLTLHERIVLRLHLYTCAACATYRRQLLWLSALIRHHLSRAEEPNLSLLEARKHFMHAFSR